MRDSFVFYRSFWEAIRELPDAQLAESIKAIANYALYGDQGNMSGVAKAIFIMAKPQIDANNKRYLNGTKGGRPVTEVEPTNNQPITKPEPNVNDNVNDNDLKEISPIGDKEKPPPKRFVPPSLKEVSAYCEEKGYKIDTERFIDYYTANGWMVGKNKMKDWKAAVRNWNRSQRQEMTTKGSNKFNQFQQNRYDFDSLEKDLLAN